MRLFAALTLCLATLMACQAKVEEVESNDSTPKTQESGDTKTSTSKPTTSSKPTSQPAKDLVAKKDIADPVVESKLAKVTYYTISEG